LIPVLQIFFAAFTAMLARANVPISAAATFVTNPLTLAPVLYGEYRVGAWLLGKNGVSPPPVDHEVSWWMSGWHTISHYGMPLVVGILVFAVLGGIIAYFAVEVVWRWRSVRKWRSRKRA
jgi:uncharacterized protein (DUF2062 family)